MNALQRAQYAAVLDWKFPPGSVATVTGDSEKWWVQGRYYGMRFNRVQLLGAFSKRRIEVAPTTIKEHA